MENLCREVFNLPHIKDVECKILDIHRGIEKRMYQHREADTQAIRELLDVRRDILNRHFIENEQSINLIKEFNDELTKALCETRSRAIKMLEATECVVYLNEELSASGKCFLDCALSPLHPVQTPRAKKIWAILSGPIDDYNKLYENGASEYRCSFWQKDSENQYLYLNDDKGNWNEGLDLELTKDLHLTYGFHNLFQHTAFSIFDLLWVRDFRIEVEVQFGTKTRSPEQSIEPLNWDEMDYYD